MAAGAPGEDHPGRAHVRMVRTIVGRGPEKPEHQDQDGDRVQGEMLTAFDSTCFTYNILNLGYEDLMAADYEIEPVQMPTVK